MCVCRYIDGGVLSILGSDVCDDRYVCRHVSVLHLRDASFRRRAQFRLQEDKSRDCSAVAIELKCTDFRITNPFRQADGRMGQVRNVSVLGWPYTKCSQKHLVLIIFLNQIALYTSTRMGWPIVSFSENGKKICLKASFELALVYLNIRLAG